MNCSLFRKFETTFHSLPVYYKTTLIVLEAYTFISEHLLLKYDFWMDMVAVSRQSLPKPWNV